MLLLVVLLRSFPIHSCMPHVCVTTCHLRLLYFFKGNVILSPTGEFSTLGLLYSVYNNFSSMFSISFDTLNCIRNTLLYKTPPIFVLRCSLHFILSEYYFAVLQYAIQFHSAWKARVGVCFLSRQLLKTNCLQ